jgi:hypothetical protein
MTCPGSPVSGGALVEAPGARNRKNLRVRSRFKRELAKSGPLPPLAPGGLIKSRPAAR